MARLNEPAPSTDAAEILRRKYSRQNKEIARINSTQCIRIRNLENEVSHLLAENLALREQIIRQTSEAKSTEAQIVVDQVNQIKSDLEAKLSELGSLLTTLGDPSSRNRKQSPEQRGPTSPVRSPDQKNWKNMCSLSEAVAGQDGRLPTIMEDKTYPRRTLNSTEILTLLSDQAADSTDSPDIGPPPVSQFVNEDPLKINLLAKAVDTENAPQIDPASSINLEHRKKRKDSVGPLEPKRPSRFEPRLSVTTAENTQSIKVGAKRKLSSRDDDEGLSSIKASELSPDEFKFTKRTTELKTPNQALKESDRALGKADREIAVARGVSRDKSSTSSSGSRKALGPKTTNVDVANSPKKISKMGLPEKKSISNGETLKDRKERQREKVQQPLLALPLSEPPTASIDMKVEPETPAGADVFSPLSSGPSVIRQESRDTPPPADFDPSTEVQRLSRRARGAVSYAEPNLRDKMRRPTKELVDAVTADTRGPRNSSIKLEEEPPLTSVRIKPEPEDDDSWKSKIPSPKPSFYSNSPLIDKTTSKDVVLKDLGTNRRRRSSSIPSGDQMELSRSTSSSTISALLAERRRIKQEEKERNLQASEPLESAMANLDIYEFSGSSPMGDNNSRAKGERHVSRISRRASSVNADPIGTSAAELSDGEASLKSSSSISSRRKESIASSEISDSESLHSGTSSISSRRRRQSTLGIGQTPTLQHDLGRPPLIDATIKRSSSITAAGDQADGKLRGERLSARRRSMML